MCAGIFPMRSSRLMRFLVLARRGQRHPLSVFALCAGAQRVTQHAELGNGEWEVQQCKSSAPLDSLER